MTVNALKLLFALIPFCSAAVHAAGAPERKEIDTIVDAAIQPVLQQYDVPGLAVGVTWKGKRYFYNYGVASKDTRRPVTDDTLFEIGSVSKTFTATLAAYASETGKLSLTAPIAQYLPDLRGSVLGKATVRDLATHTTGLPLQVPDSTDTMPRYMAYLHQWRPDQPVGTYRVYSNNGIGLLGAITADRLGQPFAEAMKRAVLDPLGLTRTYYRVPAERMADYAQGYTAKGAPIRMKGDLLWEEAYGVKTSSKDLLRFVEANMRALPADATLQRAMEGTHVAYFRAGAMGQALVWERYRYPAKLDELRAGNAAVLTAMPVARLVPPEGGQADAWLHKTGSTNGFSSYVAFVPQHRIGIVVLANKAFPIDERVRIGYEVMTRLLKSSVK